jgi:CheY-like chemotaxis protein
MMRATKFLLVEDDDDHAELVLRNLRRQCGPDSVDRVADGVEAMEYLRQEGEHAGRPRPDVILLDLNMPRMGGHEVLARVKADPRLCTIPVVVFTTSENAIDVSRAYERHVNSYLVKPADFAQFQKMAGDLGLYWGVWNRPLGNIE